MFLLPTHIWVTLCALPSPRLFLVPELIVCIRHCVLLLAWIITCLFNHLRCKIHLFAQASMDLKIHISIRICEDAYLTYLLCPVVQVHGCLWPVVTHTVGRAGHAVRIRWASQAGQLWVMADITREKPTFRFIKSQHNFKYDGKIPFRWEIFLAAVYVRVRKASLLWELK